MYRSKVSTLSRTAMDFGGSLSWERNGKEPNYGKPVSPEGDKDREKSMPKKSGEQGKEENGRAASLQVEEG